MNDKVNAFIDNVCSLIREAKGAVDFDYNPGFIVSHLDAAENEIEKIREILARRQTKISSDNAFDAWRKSDEAKALLAKHLEWKGYSINNMWLWSRLCGKYPEHYTIRMPDNLTEAALIRGVIVT